MEKRGVDVVMCMGNRVCESVWEIDEMDWRREKRGCVFRGIENITGRI